jgi:hypothetical protein
MRKNRTTMRKDRTGPILDVLPESRLRDLPTQAKSPVAQA